MFNSKQILALLVVIVTFSSYTTAFFLGWGSTESRMFAHPRNITCLHEANVQSEIPVPSSTQTQPAYYYYQRRLPALQPSYAMPQNELPQNAAPIPAIPIQVPLQAQFAPAPTVHNVQLVPCLCPVSQDFDYEKPQQENIYVNPNPSAPNAGKN